MPSSTVTTLAPGRGKPGKEMRDEERKGFKLVGHCDFGGHNTGDIMQVLNKGHFLICGHSGVASGAGTSVIDISDPSRPRVVNQIPAPKNTHTNKVQITGDILIVNNEQFGGRGPKFEPYKAGIDVYDISHLPELRHLAFFHVGGRGVHRMWYAENPYAFLTAGDDEYMDQFLKIIDLSDPTRPKEAGRWALPGMRNDEKHDWVQVEQFGFKKRADGRYDVPGDLPHGAAKRVALHEGVGKGDRAYCAWWDCGFIILDISDISKPKLVSHTQWPPTESGQTHTALPLPDRNLCIVSDEFVANDGNDMKKEIRVIDISDERNPKVISTFPQLDREYLERGGRGGPHNAHENRPGTFISSERVYWTFFNGGVRVFDIRDAYHPKEIAYYVPATPRRDPVPMRGGFELVQVQVDDVCVAEDGMVFLSERLGAGIYILEPEF